jgi:hypothetical protein
MQMRCIPDAFVRAILHSQSARDSALVKFLFQHKKLQSDHIGAKYTIKASNEKDLILSYMKMKNRPFSHSKNTAVLTDYRLICTGLASFMSKLFTNTNRKVKNAQP